MRNHVADSSWAVPVRDLELKAPGDEVLEIAELRHKFAAEREAAKEGDGGLPSYSGWLSRETYDDENGEFARFAEANDGQLVCLNMTLDLSSFGGEAVDDCSVIPEVEGHNSDTSMPLPFVEDGNKLCYYHASFSVDSPLSTSSGGTGLWFVSFTGFFKLTISNWSHIWWIEADEQKVSPETWAKYSC